MSDEREGLITAALSGAGLMRAGLFDPATIDPETLRLNAEIVKSLGTPDVKQRLVAQGFDAEGNTPEEFTELIRRDLARWQKVIGAAKIRVE